MTKDKTTDIFLVTNKSIIINVIRKTAFGHEIIFCHIFFGKNL